MAENLDSIKLKEGGTESSDRKDKGFTLPAIILGGAMGLFSVLLVADVGGGLTGAGGGVVRADGSTVLHGVGKFFSPTAPVAQSVWVILLAVLVINPLMRAMKVKFQFSTKELIVASTIASLPWGFAHYVMLGSLYPQLSVGWLQLVSGHHVARTRPPSLFEPYFEKASPLVHMKDVEVFQKFAEGGYPMDWGAWFFPTLTASLFVISIFLVSMSIAVIVRRRWTDQEHLRFPIAVVRMSLIEMQYPSSMSVGSTAEQKSPLLKNGVFWVGVLIGALEVSGVLKSIWPWWPIQGRFLTSASQAWQQNVWKAQPFTRVIGHVGAANIEWISVLWFVLDTRSLFGIVLWNRLVLPFFLAICYFNDWFAVRTKATTSTHLHPWWQIHDGTLHRMSVSAFIFTSFAALWLMRKDIKAIFKTAFSKKGERLDDSEEPMSYRNAIIVGGIAFLYMVIYGTAFNTNFLWSFLTMLILFVMVPFVWARLRGEYGMPGMGGIGWNLTNGFFRPLLGIDLVGKDNFIGIGAFNRYAWSPHCAWSGILLEGFVMMDKTSSNKDGTRRDRKQILSAGAIGILIGLIAIVGIITPMINSAGMMRQTRHTQYVASEWLVSEIVNNHSVAWNFQMEYVYLVLVTGVMIFIATWGLSKFVWWPLHPFGLAISLSDTRNVWTPVLWTWALKSLVQRYGGMPLYHKISPFMLGTLVGTSLMQLFALILATITVIAR